MGLKEIQIRFDSPLATYYAGNAVTGQIVLTLDAPKKVKAITIKFKGEANVKWVEQQPRHNSHRHHNHRPGQVGAGRGHHHDHSQQTVHYTAHEKYFENKYVLLGGAADNVEIPPGTHIYHFTTLLPPTLPSSFEGQFGHVRYTAKATLDRPWKFDQECKAAFTVVSPLDLNYHQIARVPIKKKDEKYVGSLFWKSGPLSVSLDVPFSGFVSGQYIPISIEIENQTNQNITSSQVLLRRIVTFKSTTPHSKTREVKENISNMKLGVLGAHSSNHYKENLLVPALPPSNLYNCSIIDLHYELKVETKVSGVFCRGLDLKTPIIFGTVPLTESINWAPRYQGQPSVQPIEEVKPRSNTSDWEYVNPPNVPNVPSAPQVPRQDHYPNLPPPSYEECMFAQKANILDEEDNEHTRSVQDWAPRYPIYNFNPSAPSPSK